MPVRDILFCGDPILRRKAARITEVTAEIAQLLEDMTQTMLDAPGVGLAAPQIGESVRAICVREDIDDSVEVHCLLNPQVVKAEGEEEALEGCLSLPTLQGLVIRPEKVVAEAMGLDGKPVRLEAEGLLGRALQHEIDHLDGVLFVDRVDEETLGWMVPDATDEDGYRIEPTTIDEVKARFDRLQQQRAKS
jgi:peptide deformylase